ncbi:hypothetical protein BGZ63DRAFT_413267 [Mariannaea sp. PMI_226]|nr:hypothetical protein BGZ63DRAFT_413267 [Mariannaea sp. PMI_226]
MPSSSPEPSFNLLWLPTELRDAIFSYLENRDIKNLRATCSSLKEAICLSFGRVFLSANPLNIQVFRAVANHDTFRHGVTEIVWDDVRLLREPEFPDERSHGYPDGEPEDIVTKTGCSRWFQKGRQDARYYKNGRKPVDWTLGLEESWAYYETLLEGQDQVLASNADIEVFKYGLQRFPSLKRVTITPATHGIPQKPLYKTPMIRAFPQGFGYPIPRGWPSVDYDDEPLEALPWDDNHTWAYENMYGRKCTAETYRDKWRGFRAVTKALVESGENHRVTELIIGGHEIGTGINYHIFDHHCAEYENLATLLKLPGFRRIDLDLFAGGLDNHDLVPYQNGLLYDLLAQAQDLEHVCLRSTMEFEPDYADWLDDLDLEQYILPLRTIFPIDSWPHLKHFGLSRVCVQQDDLVALLAALPASLRSVELSHLDWAREGDSYMNLLVEMRDILAWRSRPEGERPAVRIEVISRLNRGWSFRKRRSIQADDAVTAFLYEDGKNPFQLDFMDPMIPGRGGIERDQFDPSFGRPY